MSYTFVISNCGNDCHIKNRCVPALELDKNKRYEMALVNLETYWSFPNITEKNNVFRYSNGGEWFDIKLPKGAYELAQINDALKKGMGDSTSIVITSDIITLRCILTIQGNYKVDFTVPNSLNTVLGFDAQKYTKGRHESENLVKIININSIYVHNNLISHSYIDGGLHPVIYTFFPTSGVGEKIIEKPRERVYSPVTLDTISSMQTWLTDQNNINLDLQGENLTIRFHLREVANSYLEKMVELMQKSI